MNKIFVFIFLFLNIIKSDFPSIRFLFPYNKVTELNNIILFELLKDNFLQFTFDLKNFNYTGKIDFVGTVEMNFTNLTLKFDNYDNQSIKAEYLQDQNIKLNIKGINASLISNYSFRSNFYQRDLGEGVIKLDNFSYEIIYKIVHYKNNLNSSKYGPGILIKNFSVEDFDLNFEFFPIEGPLEKLFEFILLNLKNPLLDFIRTQFNNISSSINEVIKNYMENNILQINFNNSRFLNYSMNEEPQINENNFSFALELAYYSDNHYYPGDATNISFIDKNYAFNMIISQYIINSILYSLSYEGKLSRKIESDNNFLKVSKFIEAFPNLEEEYNQTQLIDLIIYPFDSPNLTITNENGFLLKINHTIEMYVRNESEIDDLAIKGNYSFEINIPYFYIKNKSFNSTISYINLTNFVCDKEATKIDVDEDIAKIGLNKIIQNNFALLNFLYKIMLQTFKDNTIPNLKNFILTPYNDYIFIGLSDENL
jgi:hypothetical protein